MRPRMNKNDISNVFCIYGIHIKGKCPNMTLNGTDPKGLEAFIGNTTGIYLGRSWKYILDNETGSEFKYDIEKKIKEIFGKKMKCKTIQAEQYDEGL